MEQKMPDFRNEGTSAAVRGQVGRYKTARPASGSGGEALLGPREGLVFVWTQLPAPINSTCVR